MRLLLKPAEVLYRGINRARRALYRAGVLKPRRLPVPVISIGNIAAGGAGKTPAVIALARYLIARGCSVTVLTRGHGRESAEEGLVMTMDAARWGDEPIVIKKNAVKIDVIVGKNRYHNATEYLLSKSCTVFLLDDGFQHLQLARDLDVVIDAPGAHFHREGRSALRDADFVIPRDVRPKGWEPLVGKRVFAFAGLADNEQFFAMLRDLGLEVVGTRGFPDHHRYTADDLTAIKREARAANAEVIVATEKDVVKVSDPEVVAVGAEFVIEPAVLEEIARRIGNVPLV